MALKGDLTVSDTPRNNTEYTSLTRALPPPVGCTNSIEEGFKGNDLNCIIARRVKTLTWGG